MVDTFYIICWNNCCIDHCFCAICIWNVALRLVFAVARQSIGFARVEELAVLLLDGTPNAWHAGVTQFDGVFIEDLSEAVGGGEVFFYQFKELPANISSYAAVEWRVEPNNLSVKVSSRCSVYIIL